MSVPRSGEVVPIAPGALHITHPVSAAIAMQWAMGASALGLARPCGRWNTQALVGSGTYRMLYRRHPGARFMRLDVYVRDTAILGTSMQLRLRITDGTTTVLESSDFIPYGFKDDPRIAPYATRDLIGLGAQGFLDLDALADAGGGNLTGSTWRLELVATFGNATARIDRVEFSELPRDGLDLTVSGGGALTYALQQGLPVAAGGSTGSDAEGLQRILHTLDQAVALRPVYLSLTWPETIGTAIPYTDSATMGVFQGLEQDVGSGVARTWIVRARRLDAAASAGESAIFGAVYALGGGAGTETATLRVETGASSSPFDLAGLAHTAGAFAFSGWKAMKLKTNGTDQLDTVAPKGKVSASGPRLYLAGVLILGGT